ncbi:MAG TPA: VOC family protein [Alphaproteobacteria bacterium]|nr:VOC family protein [Alphaproteobacteria bacterium]
MANDLGGLPKGGFARLVPELHVSDISRSLAFWRDTLGFEIAYQRPAEKFIYLELQGAQIMLCQRNGRYETGAMEHPLGQGVMFQVYIQGIEHMLSALAAVNWPLYETVKDVWYRVGANESGLRRFLVQDPDGYLVMLAENIGRRPFASSP